ncbi:MAG: hypothetical protein D8H97_17865 [Neisseria sp.]|nr:MAG: hypothetical protein D8H97_17865 [Neisseria sp.]DAP88320.1 MAG TPA: hypothetical protein [Caudoviricetes sp.]
MTKQREFTFTYKFGGKYWSASVFADSVEEAKRKIRAQASAVYEGEIVARIPVICRISWINRLLAWVNRSEK